MAKPSKLQNVAQLFANAKTRTILLVTLGIIVFGALIAGVGLHERGSSTVPGSAQTTDLPDIESIPGVEQESPAYQKAQQQQNIKQAQEAEKSGGSAVATFTNSLQSVGGAGQGNASSALLSQGGTGANGSIGEANLAGSTPGGQNGASTAAGSGGPGSAGVGGLGVPGSGVPGSGVAGSGVAGSGVAGSGVAGSGVAGSGVAGSGVAGSGVPGSEIVGEDGASQGIGDSGAASGSPNAGSASPRNSKLTPAQQQAAALAAQQLAAYDSPEARQFRQFQQQLSQQQLQAEEQLATQQIQNLAKNTQDAATAMTNQAKDLLSGWNVSTQVYVAGEGASAQNGGAGGTGSGGNGGGVPSGPPLLKAGTIEYATLDTAVNTDEPGPVMATIQQGPLKGTKLLGTLQPANSQFANKVVLSFNTMSMPTTPNSIQVSAVAVDPATSRTALATSVDHHYLERYGTLLASSFLEGYGSAIADSGSIQYYYPSTGGGVSGFSVLATKDTAQQIAMAFGQVGETLGEQLGNVFNRPPTIEVAAGSEVGILFLQDVSSASS